MIDSSLEAITVSRGETVELPCVASQAYPTPTFRWSKDGNEVIPDGRRLAQNGGNLVVQSARVSDSGEYTCTSVNSHGKDETVTLLTVTCKIKL